MSYLKKSCIKIVCAVAAAAFFFFQTKNNNLEAMSICSFCICYMKVGSCDCDYKKPEQQKFMCVKRNWVLMFEWLECFKLFQCNKFENKTNAELKCWLIRHTCTLTTHMRNATVNNSSLLLFYFSRPFRKWTWAKNVEFFSNSNGKWYQKLNYRLKLRRKTATAPLIRHTHKWKINANSEVHSTEKSVISSFSCVFSYGIDVD